MNGKQHFAVVAVNYFSNKEANSTVIKFSANPLTAFKVIIHREGLEPFGLAHFSKMQLNN